MDKYREDNLAIIHQWLDEMNGLTAREKLLALIEKGFKEQHLHSLDDILTERVQSPHFIAAYMQWQ